MVRFTREQGGWLTMQDLAEFHVEVEEPVNITYRGYESTPVAPGVRGRSSPRRLISSNSMTLPEKTASVQKYTI